MNRNLYLTLCLLLTGLTAFGQNRTISGTVKDAETNEALPGVSVFVQEDPSTGTITDLDGQYSLAVPESSTTLVFKFVGYEDQYVAIAGQNKIDVSLELTSLNLDAVVISASRRQEKILDAPASISLITTKQINNTVAISPTDNLKGVPGVDIINTGLVQTNVVTRGFNNIFSGALLTMVDNRYAAVPSLRVNVNMFIPTDNSDLERIEVLRGPASALYGPNCANGVLHMITKSPLDQDDRFQTTVSLGGGFRQYISDTIAIANPIDPITGLVDTAYSPLFDDDAFGDRAMYSAAIRHSGKINDKLGYKILGTYFAGNDWLYDDPFEPNYIYKGYQTSEGRVTTDTVPTLNTRNNDINKMGVDLRLDYRPDNISEWILAGGITQNDGIEMTGIGAGQAIDWRYYYGQIRYRRDRLFTQVFLNGSDAGQTYLFRTGDQIIDKSKQLAAQVQYSSDHMNNDLTLIYGIDFIETMPQTESTINGQYENDDNITEVGAYIQGKYMINSKLELLAALRGDYHNFVDQPFVSPRAAVVYKPSTRQTFRLTYNRAFSAPSSNNLNLDILQLADLGDLGAFGQSLFGLDYIPGIGVRATGNRGGFTYSYDNNGFAQFLSPYASFIGDASNTYYSISGNDQLNNITWDMATVLLFQGFAEATGLPLAQVQLLFGPLLPDDISSVSNVMRLLNLTTEEFDLIDPNNIQDFGGILNSATNTFELGWKGSLMDDKVFATVDVYQTTIQDFVGPLTNITPNVFLDPESLTSGIYAEMFAAWEDPSNAVAVSLLTGALDENGDGDAFPEWVATVVGAGAGVPMGTVVPTELDQPAIYVTYVNLGDVTVYGADLGATIYVNDDFRVSLGYSWIDKDSIALEGAQLGYVALNAPANKASLKLSYDIKKIDLNVGATFRWQASYPANSGAYVGTVESINDLDLTLNYAPHYMDKTVFSLLVSNVYNREQQYFVGAPVMGRSLFFKATRTF
ncbi:MAG: TonB-dependent receptor [Chitinophagales bacterium]|nr:TonB-dependent receptor [Chitinophagales bacterium]MCB9020553.1 TonB-dependent receptor [Chitinophagales bacterium]HPE97076.1 TonB-dependent receptor [Chitinophagales bacterium]HPE98313.1 TonB-dependent receptor [Chitinophagales bacterium]HRX23226.1 TonB-dependent receptor [Chitinophagales bacterium]